MLTLWLTRPQGEEEGERAAACVACISGVVTALRFSELRSRNTCATASSALEAPQREPETAEEHVLLPLKAIYITALVSTAHH